MREAVESYEGLEGAENTIVQSLKAAQLVPR